MDHESAPKRPIRSNNSSRYDESMIKIVSARDIVRETPWMFIGSVDVRGLHELLARAVSGLVRHHRDLEQPLDAISVRLESSESVCVSSQGSMADDLLLERGSQLFERELTVWENINYADLFIVAALSAHLSATVRVTRRSTRTLTFNHGVLQHHEVCVAPGEGGDITRLCFRPDYTVFDHTRFDYDHTWERLRPLANDQLPVTVNVLTSSA